MMAKQSGSDSVNTPQSGASLQSGSVSVEEQPERTWSAPAQTWRQTFSENEWKQDFREIKDLGKGSSRARLRRSLLLIPFFLLGRLTGSYGKVLSAIDRMGQKVAIKQVPNVFESRIQALRLLREIRILRYLQREVGPHHCIIGPSLFLPYVHFLNRWFVFVLQGSWVC